MTIRRIPQNHRWTGPYLGSYYGDLWKTFNVDLDRNEGKIGLSQRMEIIEDSTELTDLSGSNVVRTFLRTNADCEERYWAANANALYKTDSNPSPSPDNDWDTDGLDSSPTAAINDMSVHGNDSRNDSGRNKLVVTTDCDISVLNDTGNSAWTRSWWITKQGQPALDSSYFHPIEYFSNRKITLVGDGNLVHTISRPSDTQNDTITRARLILPRDLVIKHIFTTAERAWLCCYSKRSENGAVVEWDGYSQSPNQIHHTYGMGVLSGVSSGGTPLVVNSGGTFLEYTGNGFIPMIRNGQRVAFPTFEEIGNTMLDNSLPTAPLFKIHGRGMTAGEDGLIYINTVSAAIESARHGGGIWCLNPTTGRFYNKNSLSRTYDTADYGQQPSYAGTPGALYWVSSSVFPSVRGRTLLAGGVVYSSATTNTTGIWLSQPYDNELARGYFITQYIPADEVQELWDTLWLRLRPLRRAGNSIIVKARGVRPLATITDGQLFATITWTSTTTFTVTLNSAYDALAVGDEIEVLRGVNAGYLAHITVISGAHGALQTITVDETVAAGSGTSSCRFDRWKKIGTITDVNAYSKMVNIGIDSSFIQFKVELRGLPHEVEVSDLAVVSKPSIQLEN